MKNFVREKIAEGKSVCGIWSILPSPVLSEIIALSSFDFQILDMEHGLYDIGTLDSAIRSSELNFCSPIVRTAELNQAATQKILDLGAHGIIYPQILDANDALKAVQLTKYHPLGTRGFNPFTRSSNYNLNVQNGSHRNHNDFSMTGVIVENYSAVKNLDPILQIAGLDIVYIGAYDLSVALGKPGDMKNPELLDLIEKSILKIRKEKKIAGVMAQTPEDMKKYQNLGANFVVLGVDSFLIGKSLSDLQSQFSKIY